MHYNEHIPGMRRSHWISLGAFALVVCLPLGAHAASTGVFNAIIPSTGQCTCPGSAPDWGCALQTFQTLFNDFISLAVLLIVLLIARAGFTYITNPTSPEKRQLANKQVLNAVIGLMIVLSSWLIIDSVMKVLYNQGSQFGPWNSILVAGDPSTYCIKQQQSPGALVALSQVGNTANAGGGTVSASSGVLPQNGSGSCSPSTVKSAAAAGGYNISTAEANTLACLAKPESACGTNTSGATTVAGSPTTASGPWQILLGAKDTCHSLTIPACGNLNCSAAYSGGKVKSDAASIALAQQCQAAANNLTCSAAAAACLVQANGGSYSAWTSDSRSSAQKTCIANYSNGN